MIERAKAILKKEINALEMLPLNDADISRCVGLFVNCQGKVILTGVGKAGLVARKISASLSSTGTPSFFMDTTDAQHGDLGVIGDRDVLVALSNSGKTQEVLLTLRLCKEISSCPIIGITSSKNSEMAQFCDLILEIGKIEEVCPFGLAPTCSTTVMMALGDILSVLTMEEKEFSLEDYGKRHHGGYLGNIIKEMTKRK